MTASFRIRDTGSVDRLVTAFQMIDGGSVDRTIVQGRVIGLNRVDRVFYDPSGATSFTVSALPASVSGTSGTTTVTSASTTATPAGGTGPYTHAWTVVSHSSATLPTVTSPASATTTFVQTNVAPGETQYGTFRDTVTDSLGNTTYDDVTAIFLSPSGGGGGGGGGGGSGGGGSTLRVGWGEEAL